MNSICRQEEIGRFTVLFFLLLILALGASARLYRLGELPSGLGRDEVSTGYDAYSIMKTGRDQYGKLLPLFARSYGDFNEALYRYLSIPAVYFFGLCGFSVRLPAAVFGSLSILVLFLLGKEFFGSRAALFQAFFLAVSPWHLHFSRVGFRVILFPFFLLLALILWMKAMKRPSLLPIAAAAFVLSAYTYSAARVFVPLFLIGLCFIFSRELRAHSKITSGFRIPSARQLRPGLNREILNVDRASLEILLNHPGQICGTSGRVNREGIFARALRSFRRRDLLISILVLMVGFSLLASFWFSPHGMSRAEGVLRCEPSHWLRSYLHAFSPQFLLRPSKDFFVSEMTDCGLLYFLQAPFLLLGLGAVFLEAFLYNRPFAKTIILGLVLYPIPAIFTVGGLERRALIGSVFFPMLSGLGLCLLLQWVKRRALKRVLGAAVLIALLSLFSQFVTRYSDIYTPASWFHWDHGWEEAIHFAQEHSAGEILISNFYPTPHFFILFYSKYPPEEYQKHPKQMEGRGQKIESFRIGNFQIGSVADFSRLPDTPELVICPPAEIRELDPHFAYKLVKEIKSPIGYVPFVILRPERVKGQQP